MSQCINSVETISSYSYCC